MIKAYTLFMQACDSLINEHRQVEVLLEALKAGISQEDIPGVRQAMLQLVPEMNTHFACEEQALFPAVSPYHSMVLMEVEHEALIALREDLAEVIAASDWSGIRSLGKTFINEMLDHIAREDAGIFPACERSLSETEKLDVVAGMDQIRALALETPTPTIQRSTKTFHVMTLDLNADPTRPVFSERLENPGLESKHLVIQAGESLPAHWTPKAGTLVCLQGTGEFTANEQSVSLKSGVMIAISPQLTYGLKAETTCHFLLFLST